LPPGLRLFFRHRTFEAIGVALATVAVLLAIALATYHPGDPSWNNATVSSPRNMIGMPGAHASDLLLQTLGLGAALVPFLMLAWAYRLFVHQGLPRLWLKLTLAPFSLLFAAAVAASLPAFAGWPIQSGLGGVLGDVVHNLAQSAGLSLLPTAPPAVWDSIVATLGLLALVVSLGFTVREWRGMGGGAIGAARSSAVGVGRGLLGLVGLARRVPVGLSAPGPLIRPEPRMSGRPEPRLKGERAAPSLRTARSAAPALREEGRAGVIIPPQRDESRVRPRAPSLKTSKRAKAEAEPALDLGGNDDFQLPPLSLLQSPPAGSRTAHFNKLGLEQNARLLETVLGEFGVHGTISEVNPGPVVTRYDLDPQPGTKTSRVIGLADDIARSMSSISARVAVIQGRNLIGIELPNSERETVFLRELLSTPEYENTAGRLTLALGKNIAGEPVVSDLSRMPHLLIAGTTGSGKSVAVNTMILSLLYRLTPEQCRLILIDPKMLELSVYDGIPHLLAPVVTEPGKAVVALKWVVREMQTRYRSMSRLGVRNVAGYNQRVAEALANGEQPKRTVQTGYDASTGEPMYEEQALDLKPMPFIVVVVDEMADLMMVAGKDVEAAIQRLSQMARAAGIHLIMATQRPSVDVITGTIKANFPTRISFQVTSKIDSRTILNEQGAEQLLGQGDMLFMESGGRVQRVHGPFVSDTEVEAVVKFLKRQGVPEYLEEVTAEPETIDGDIGSPGDGGGGGGDELYQEAVAIVLREQRASTSFVQRHLQIGYNRAARLIERMETEGIVSAPDRVGKREVLSGSGVG
jgi:S-DNA-T family DNA segregation ATPase FtsK/SpoIIIE